MNSNHSPDSLCVFLKSIEDLLAGVQNTVLLKTFPGCGSVDMMVKLIGDSCLVSYDALDHCDLVQDVVNVDEMVYLDLEICQDGVLCRVFVFCKVPIPCGSSV
jgi:hypothetical protein